MNIQIIITKKGIIRAFLIGVKETRRQGKDNLLLFPDMDLIVNEGKIECHQRLNGILKYYYRSAA